MDVTIKRSRARFFHAVHCLIEFSDKEKSIIWDRNLHLHAVYNHRHHSDNRTVTLADFYTPHVRFFSTAVGAQKWELELKKVHLPKLKRIIEARPEPATSPTVETFTL